MNDKNLLDMAMDMANHVHDNPPQTPARSIYNVLRQIDVTEYTRDKNGFDYLPWAKAWDLLCEKFPDSNWEVVMFDGLPYLKTEVGYFVKTMVRINDVSKTEMMPVISFNNKDVPKPTGFNINSSIRRCLAKNIAKFGLGINLYVGEEFVAEGGQFSEQIKAEFDEAFDKGDGLSIVAIKHDVGMDTYFSLYNSFPQGQKGDMKAECSKLEEEGSHQFNEYLNSFIDYIQDDDQAGALDVWEALTKRQCSAIWKQLPEGLQTKFKTWRGVNE